MKKIITLLFGLTLLGTVQVASAAYDLNHTTGTIKKLSTCTDDAAIGYIMLWLEDDASNVTVFAISAAAADSDQSQVRKNVYSTALAAKLAKEEVEVIYMAGTGTRCEVAYDYVLRGVSIGTL